MLAIAWRTEEAHDSPVRIAGLRPRLEPVTSWPRNWSGRHSTATFKGGFFCGEFSWIWRDERHMKESGVTVVQWMWRDLGFYRLVRSLVNDAWRIHTVTWGEHAGSHTGPLCFLPCVWCLGHTAPVSTSWVDFQYLNDVSTHVRFKNYHIEQITTSLFVWKLCQSPLPIFRRSVLSPSSGRMSINYCLIKEPICLNTSPWKCMVSGDKLHTLTSTLDGGGWSASSSGRFTPR